MHLALIMNPDFIALGLLWYVVFLLSTTCHEAAHALVAKWGGDSTAFQGGQVTLNPIPHIRRELVGMVIVPIVSYAAYGFPMGWASAPYDPNWCRHNPRQAAKMALAGPAANFILVILAAIAMKVGVHSGVLAEPDGFGLTSVVDAVTAGGLADGMAKFLSIVFSLNILLGTFNLIPVPPLDGFNVVPLFLSEGQGQRYLEWADSVRRYSLVGLMVAWLLYYKMFWPIFTVAVQTLYR